MKIKYLFLTLAALLIAGCSDELDRGGAYNPEKGVTATIPTYPFADGTRVNISDDLQTFTWSDGDELGIYTRDNELTADARFKILQGGSSTGNFSNDMFYLNSNRSYYSFYPYQPYGEIDSVPVDYTGQTQNGNGSAAHLGAYNYMYGIVNINSNGGASIAYKNLGAVMQLRLTVSNPANYTGIDITSDGTEFITKGTASMINGSITATETSASIHLDFESCITLNAGDVLTANILVAPVDMSGSTLTITLTDIDEKNYELTTEGKNMLQGKAYLYEQTMPYMDDDVPYVTFTADSEQTFQMSYAVSTLEYSVNGGIWTTLGTSKVTFGGGYGNLRLRGRSSSGTDTNYEVDHYGRWAYPDGANITFGYATRVACHGDIRTLVDYRNYTTTDTSEARFDNLFKNCFLLTSAPELPATYIADYCYMGMFSGCTSLTQAPSILPATNLEFANDCYASMFSGCTSLTQAPELPATRLTYGCYASMFKGCTSLTQAPELPATNLAYAFNPYHGDAGCYESMFEGCTALTQAPELPATTLTDGFSNRNAYASMFKGCTALTQAPELPATKLVERCYSSMFYGCTALTQAPELPATYIASYCYSSMFEGCTALTQAPSILPAIDNFYASTACYSKMFKGCTSLTQAPELPATSTSFEDQLNDGCYSQMFYGCSKLNYIKMMATEIYYNASEGLDIQGALEDWVLGVSATGTFVKNKDATWGVTGSSGIPSGWTTIYYNTDTGKYFLDRACTQECDDHGNPL